MTLNELKDAIIIGFILATMIGPVFFMLLQTSILKGFKAAIAFDLGVILGDIAFILIAYFGSRSFLEQIKDNPRFFYLGGTILFIYGLVMFLDKKMKGIQDNDRLIIVQKTNYFKLFIEGFLLNFINVGVLAFWLGLVIVVTPNIGTDSVKYFRFFGTIVLSYLIFDIAKITLAKQLKSKLTPALIYKIKRGMGIVLMIFGIVLFFKGFFPKSGINVGEIIESQK
ncbi:MAG: LysE family transporter [Flavobacteriaceae bacterium]|nr:LysE family transporter [Flavobacteriaceae bacterium]